MEPFLGQIQPFGFNFAPRGWALCDGQLLPIAQYSALFSLYIMFYTYCHAPDEPIVVFYKHDIKCYFVAKGDF